MPSQRESACEEGAFLPMSALFAERADDLGRDVKEEDGANERQREDEDNKRVTERRFRNVLCEAGRGLTHADLASRRCIASALCLMTPQHQLSGLNWVSRRLLIQLLCVFWWEYLMTTGVEWAGDGQSVWPLLPLVLADGRTGFERLVA